jgi:hypothetical protein
MVRAAKILRRKFEQLSALAQTNPHTTTCFSAYGV